MGFPSSCELAESRWSVVAACPIPRQSQSSLLRAAKNTNQDYVNRIRSSRYKMPATIYYDNDADLSLLKDKIIAILGYGSQGHAQAQNLRDSGCNVIVGQRPGSPNYELAVSHGFEPMPIDEATKRGDLINILLPDEVQGDIFKDHILKNLSEGNILMCSHGFNLHFGQVEAPPGVDTLLVAPKGPGHLVRSEFEKGGGVPSLIAVGKGASEETKQLGLAYAKGIGGTRGGVIETTIAEETETDLFGEQVVLCGGVSELVKAAFETLVDAGYQPEMAYFECLHELKLIVDLFYQGGLSYMRYSVSNTAEYGDYSRGPRIINDDTRAEMKKILEEIQTGKFAREWILENRAGAPAFKAVRRRDRSLQIEDVGRRLRSLMSWIDSKEV
ncbi:MAG: ketol-acid reductoisomerase [Pirellulaceae bacterium]|nr:ketol-acid reductoisomerase [Pirellulaceae bacterium]